MKHQRLSLNYLRHLCQLTLISSLLAAACGGPVTPTAPPVQPSTSEPTQPAPPPPAEPPAPELEDFTLECEQPFDDPGSQKGDISLDGLPLPDGFEAYGEVVLNEQRVVGFMFTDGQIGLIATPARERCEIADPADPALGTVLGVVWTFKSSPPGGLDKSYLISVNQDTGIGFLISDRQIVSDEFTRTDLIGEGGPTIDAAISASSVCFRLENVRYCSQTPELSVKDLFSDAYGELSQRVEDAQRNLTDAGYLDESEAVQADQAISEIEDRERIAGCQPTPGGGNCPADIIVAPIMASQNSPVNLGILIVDQDLMDLPDGVQLEAGSYVVHISDDLDPSSVKVSGIESDSGAEIIDQEIPATLAPFANDEGTVTISSCQIWIICLFWECR